MIELASSTMEYKGMPDSFISLILVFVSYLLGSISTGIILSKLLRLTDPRDVGSNSAGATNMLRIAGKKIALFTLLGDCLKAIIAIGLANLFDVGEWTLGFICIAVFIGHLFPLFFHFQGGKGIATALGICLMLHWTLGFLLLWVWIVVFLLFRYSSLASIAAAVIAPILGAYWLPTPLVLTLVVLTLLILWKHVSNIQRLMEGTEQKIKL